MSSLGMRRRRGSFGAAVLSGALLALHAAAQPPPPSKTFTLAIAGGKLAPAQPSLRAAKGEEVAIELTSDTAGEVHLHGYRLAAKLAPGVPARWRFNAYATGRYRLEWHGAGGTAAQHHGPPLATLEVLPQ